MASSLRDCGRNYSATSAPWHDGSARAYDPRQHNDVTGRDALTDNRSLIFYALISLGGDVHANGA